MKDIRVVPLSSEVCDNFSFLRNGTEQLRYYGLSWIYFLKNLLQRRLLFHLISRVSAPQNVPWP